MWAPRQLHSDGELENISFYGLAGVDGVLDPPPAGCLAAFQPGCSLFVLAGAASQWFSPQYSCWQSLMTAQAETFGL